MSRGNVCGRVPSHPAQHPSGAAPLHTLRAPQRRLSSSYVSKTPTDPAPRPKAHKTVRSRTLRTSKFSGRSPCGGQRIGRETGRDSQPLMAAVQRGCVTRSSECHSCRDPVSHLMRVRWLWGSTSRANRAGRFNASVMQRSNRSNLQRTLHSRAIGSRNYVSVQMRTVSSLKWFWTHVHRYSRRPMSCVAT